MMEPPASLEDEFNAWYDGEHLPQRRNMPGFRSATRWECVDGWPRWMALYQLDSLTALNTEEYLAVSGSNATPWSQRIYARVRGVQRASGESIDLIRHDDRGISRLLIAAYPAADTSAQLAQVREQLAAREDLAYLQAFVHDEGNGKSVWFVAGFTDPLIPNSLLPLLGATDGKDAKILNVYVPYA